MAKLFKTGERVLADIKSSELPDKVAKGVKEAAGKLAVVGYTLYFISGVNS